MLSKRFKQSYERDFFLFEVVKLQKIPPQEGLSEDTLDVLQITISEMTKYPWLMAFLSTMLTQGFIYLPVNLLAFEI